MYKTVKARITQSRYIEDSQGTYKTVSQGQSIHESCFCRRRRHWGRFRSEHGTYKTFKARFDLYNKSPDSSERQEKHGPVKGDLIPLWGLAGRRQPCLSPAALPADVERWWHIQDSQGQVLVLAFRRWEECRESRRCSRDTDPESYITKYTSVRR